jgi:hypothetical protein
MLQWKAANSSSSILAFIFHVAMVFLLGFTHLFGISQVRGPGDGDPPLVLLGFDSPDFENVKHGKTEGEQRFGNISPSD